VLQIRLPLPFQKLSRPCRSGFTFSLCFFRPLHRNTGVAVPESYRAPSFGGFEATTEANLKGMNGATLVGNHDAHGSAPRF